MDNEKDTPNTINDMMEDSHNSPDIPPIMSQNDSIEVNNLISLSDSDITPDLLQMLEEKAKAESSKMNFVDNEIKEEENKNKQEDIQMAEGLPAEGGAVDITGEITERPMDENAMERPVAQKQEEKLDPLQEAQMNAIYKKYVIYIDKENEEFIDSLSLNERKLLINKILTEQNALTIEERAEKKRKQKLAQMILAVVTFMITVPVVYFIFNVSMETTIQNYKHSKSNFEVLYKETGKIKLNN